MVAALEISSSTTQLLVASRVKATVGSGCLNNLESAAKDVLRVTGDVVASVQNASSVTEKSRALFVDSKLVFTCLIEKDNPNSSTFSSLNWIWK